MKRKFIAFYITFLILIINCLIAVSATTPEEDSLSLLSKKGYSLLLEGRTEEAAKLYRKVINQYADSDAGIEGKRSLMKIYNNLGYLYLFEYHSPERAYPLLIKARDLALKYDQPDLLAASYGNIAILYDDFGDTENALGNFRLSLEACKGKDTEEMQSIRIMAFVSLANFAIHHNLIDSIGESILLYEKFPAADVPMGSYTNQLARSLNLVTQKRYLEAYSTLENAGSFIDAEVDSTRFRLNHIIALAALARLGGEKSLAMSHLENGLKIIDASPTPLSDLKIRIFNNLSEILREEGKEKEADHYRLQALEVTDSIYGARKFGNIRDIESMNFIDELNRNMELSELELKHQRRQTWILSIAIIVVLILFAGLGWYTKKLNRTHLSLVRRHKESMQQRDVELRIHNEYREKVETLKLKNEQLEKLLNQDEGIQKDRPLLKENLSEKQENPRKIPGNPEEHLQKIDEIKTIFATDPIIYDSSFSLNQLAEILHSKPKYISILINDFLGTTFNQLLAEARVAESCKLLLDSEIGQKLTIEAVAEKVGYRSRTHFISIFNKITGLTPSQYIKASKKNV